jgi:hypothetical protein
VAAGGGALLAGRSACYAVQVSSRRADSTRRRADELARAGLSLRAAASKLKAEGYTVGKSSLATWRQGAARARPPTVPASFAALFSAPVAPPGPPPEDLEDEADDDDPAAVLSPRALAIAALPVVSEVTPETRAALYWGEARYEPPPDYEPPPNPFEKDWRGETWEIDDLVRADVGADPRVKAAVDVHGSIAGAIGEEEALGLEPPSAVTLLEALALPRELAFAVALAASQWDTEPPAVVRAHALELLDAARAELLKLYADDADPLAQPPMSAAHAAELAAIAAASPARAT